MSKIENILAVVFSMALVFSLSCPYLAFADATVNGFFPKNYVVTVKKKKRSNYRVLARNSGFAQRKVNFKQKDSFAISENKKFSTKQ